MNRTTSLVLSGLFLAASIVFVWRSFYGMRITTAQDDGAVAAPRRRASPSASSASRRARRAPGRSARLAR